MHTDANRWYEILGVDPSASDKAIRVAFRRLAKQFHPDSPAGDAGAFILLKRAYDVISDPARRAAYDRACQPPPASEPHRWAEPRPLPPMPPPFVPRRRGGMGIARYVIAFIIMAAISLGGVQAMISLTEAPASIKARPTVTSIVTPAGPEPAAAEAPVAPGSSKSGFWDASPKPAPLKN